MTNETKMSVSIQVSIFTGSGNGYVDSAGGGATWRTAYVCICKYLFTQYKITKIVYFTVPLDIEGVAGTRSRASKA